MPEGDAASANFSFKLGFRGSPKGRRRPGRGRNGDTEGGRAAARGGEKEPAAAAARGGAEPGGTAQARAAGKAGLVARDEGRLAGNPEQGSEGRAAA